MKTYDGGWSSKQGGLGVGNRDGLHLSGDATMWDDLVRPILGKRLDTTSGTVDYDWDNLFVEFSANGNVDVNRNSVGVTYQKEHKVKLDSIGRLHMHWVQKDTTEREMTVKYRFLEPGSAFASAWTTVVCPVTAATAVAEYPGSGDFMQITELCDIDYSGKGISTEVQVRMSRTDSVAGVISVSTIDMHVEIDTVGSAEEYSKFVG